jgi:hypothetical protein
LSGRTVIRQLIKPESLLVVACPYSALYQHFQKSQSGRSGRLPRDELSRLSCERDT